MKIKIKGEDDISVHLDHQELVILKCALEEYNLCPSNLWNLNNQLYDKDEFEKVQEFEKKKNKMLSKMRSKLSKFIPY